MDKGQIDLVQLFKFFVKRKWVLLKVISIFVGFGILIIFLTRNHYQSSIKFIPESSSSTGAGDLLSQISGIAGAGFRNLGTAEKGISPNMYQEVVRSYPYLHQLSQEEISVASKEPQKIEDYILENIKPSVFQWIKRSVSNLFRTVSSSPPTIASEPVTYSDSVIFTRKELIPVFNQLREMMQLENDKEAGTTMITVESLDPEVSAQIAAKAYKLLAQYIVDNKTSKEVQNLHFVQERFEEVGANFLDAQLKLASFRDKNQNIMLSSTRITEERLQAEFNLQNTLYNNLAMQLEQAKIKVQERTPVFSLINPAIVSSQPSKPNIPLIMALMVVMGFIVSFLWLLVAFIRNEFSTAYRA